MLDLTPTTHIIESYRNTIPNYRVLCGEAVDNSFDAGAQSVDIIIDKQKIIFRDDGVGVTNSRVVSLCKLGSHAGMDSTRLGRYGIGIKEQAAAAGDQFEVSSRSSDGLMRLGINWRELSKAGTWEVSPPMWNMGQSDDATFTEIKISELRNIPKQAQINKVAAELARMFQPALVSGRKITLNGLNIDPIKDPAMKHVVQAVVTINEDKYATLKAGVLVDPASSILNHVHIGYEHRIIKAQDLFGCDDGIGASLMFARINLFGHWDLGKNKTELTDADAADLENQVEDLLSPILARCRKDALSAVVSDAETAINEMLPAELRPNRPEKKRVEPPRQGKKLKRKEIRVVTDASDTPTGPTRGTQKASKISFDLIPGLKDERGNDVVGQVKVNGKRIVVQIRSDVSVVRELIEKRNFGPLYMIGLQIYAEGIRRVNCEFDFADFGAHVFNLMNLQPVSFCEAAE